MKLYIKQHVFTWRDRFSIFDENGFEKYFVEGEIFTFGKRLHLMEQSGNELAYIHQKLLSFLPKYLININGRDIAEVVKELTFFNQEYYVNGLGWNVVGDFFAHEYEIRGGGRLLARIYKEWFTWGDAYAIDIDSTVDEISVLAVVLVIDAVISDNHD